VMRLGRSQISGGEWKALAAYYLLITDRMGF
jgi:hypothetical protein